MENGIYLITTFVSVFWSFNLYSSWETHGKGEEESPVRFILMVFPSSIFLILAFFSWHYAEYFRLDLAVLVMYSVFMLVGWVILRLKNYLLAVLVYSILSFLLIILVLIVHRFPIVLMKIAFYLETLGKLDSILAPLVTLQPQNEIDQLYGYIQKVGIALFSYIPITLFRFLYLRRIRQQFLKEIGQLRKEVSQIRSRLDSKE